MRRKLIVLLTALIYSLNLFIVPSLYAAQVLYNQLPIIYVPKKSGSYDTAPYYIIPNTNPVTYTDVNIISTGTIGVYTTDVTVRGWLGPGETWGIRWAYNSNPSDKTAWTLSNQGNLPTYEYSSLPYNQEYTVTLPVTQHINQINIFLKSANNSPVGYLQIVRVVERYVDANNNEIVGGTWPRTKNFAPNPTPPAPPPVITSIELNPVNSSIQIGQSLQYQVIARYSDGSTQNITSLSGYLLSDGSVASISSGGNVTGLVSGVTQVTATYSGMSAVASLTVVEPPPPPTPTELEIVPPFATIKLNEGLIYKAILHYSDGSIQDVTAASIWSIQDTRIAQITSNGLASANGPGSTVVTSNYNGLFANADLIVVTSQPVTVPVYPPLPPYQPPFLDGGKIDVIVPPVTVPVDNAEPGQLPDWGNPAISLPDFPLDPLLIPDPPGLPDGVILPDLPGLPDEIVLPDPAIGPDTFLAPDSVVGPDTPLSSDPVQSPEFFMPDPVQLPDVLSPDPAIGPDTFLAPDSVVGSDIPLSPDLVQSPEFFMPDPVQLPDVLSPDSAIGPDTPLVPDPILVPDPPP